MNPDQYAASVVDAIPTTTVALPYFGEFDATPYLAGVALFLLLTLAFRLVRHIILEQLKRLSGKTSTDLDDTVIDAVRGVRPWVYNLIAVYFALTPFAIPTLADRIITGLVLFAVVWQVIQIAGTFVQYGAARFLEKDEDGDGEVDPNAATMSNMVKLIAKIILWALGGLFVLSNVGIDVTSLIAGLGIGGIAIAFALQGILSDLFASFSIYMDKPFRVGDFINVGTDYGTVEKIGIKSTRLRTLQGEELVISNAELTTARINNFKKMDERRIVAHFGIIYETPYEKVTQVTDIIKTAFDAVKGGRLDRVHFTTFGDYALEYELVYYVESADYNEYLDIQQNFNFELLRRFEEHGIEFAYPTQTQFTKVVGEADATDS